MYMEQFEDKPTLEQIKEEYSEIVSIFPALHKYKILHNTENLQKLCVELSSFFRAIYASTENDKERDIIRSTIDKLGKI